MKLQEEKYLQATAPTRVEIIREQVLGPTTHIHPTIAQPDNSDQIAQVGQMVGHMHRTLSEHAARQAGDMRESMRQWLKDAHSVWNRPPPTAPQPIVDYTPGQPSSSGLDRSAQTSAQRAARSAEIHAAHEGKRARPSSPQPAPQPAGESTTAAVAVVKQRTTPARVTKPKAIATPWPKKYGPKVGAETTPDPPPPPPPPQAPPVRKRKEPEPERETPRPHPRGVAKAKARSRSSGSAPVPAPAPVPTPAQPAKKRKTVAPPRPDQPKRQREPEAEPEAEPAIKRKRRTAARGRRATFAVGPV